MKTIFALAVAAFFAVPAAAHTMSEHGNITTVYPDQADTGIFALVESVAPGAVPNGLFFYTVNGVQGGDTFSVIADDGQEPFVVGTADECPGPDSFDVDDPNWWLEEMWILCNNHPDFDVKFTGGEYGNGPGDEGGSVPGSGAAVVTLFFGDAGEGFTYSES